MAELFRETASGAVVPVDQLSAQMTTEVGVLCQCNVLRGVDQAGDADPTKDQVRIFTAAALSAPDITAAEGAIAGFSETTPEGRTGELVPNPPSNTWATVPGTSIDIDDETLVSGSIIIRCFLGASLEPCGTTLTFAASRTGGASKLESWGLPGGRVSQFNVQAILVGDTIVCQVRRRGSATVRARADISFDVEATP